MAQMLTRTTARKQRDQNESTHGYECGVEFPWCTATPRDDPKPLAGNRGGWYAKHISGHVVQDGDKIRESTFGRGEDSEWILQRQAALPHRVLQLELYPYQSPQGRDLQLLWSDPLASAFVTPDDYDHRKPTLYGRNKDGKEKRLGMLSRDMIYHLRPGTHEDWEPRRLPPSTRVALDHLVALIANTKAVVVTRSNLVNVATMAFIAAGKEEEVGRIWVPKKNLDLKLSALKQADGDKNCSRDSLEDQIKKALTN